MPTRLILIRHGQTRWNLKKRYLSFSDIGLNNKGIGQAKQLKVRLDKEKIYKVYSSDTRRALNFARIAFRGFFVEKTPELREMNFGIFEGLTYKQIMKNYPVIYKKWLNDPYSITIPEGEGLREFKERVARALKKIVALHRNKTVAVVCHGGVISSFLNHIIKSKNFWKRIPDSSSLSIVEYRDGKPKIKLFNDTTHLS